MAAITENQVEQEAIGWLQDLGYDYKPGGDIASDGAAPERGDYHSVILKDRLAEALRRLNPDGIPQSAIDDGIPQLANPNIPGLLSCNRAVHEWLTKGITVTYHKGGQEIGRQLKVFDFDNPQNNDWLVVDQFTVKGVRNTRRPDLVVFVNGLPLAVFELKNPISQSADIWDAYNQLQTYAADIPDLFHYNACLVISDGIDARMGALLADKERFMRWRTIDGDTTDPLGENRALETLIRGAFRQDVFLNYLRDFCLFEEGNPVTKKIAAYHQYHAVQKAVESIVRESAAGGSKQGGVVWHTQGAGKSIEMAFLAGRLVREPDLKNPTLVMVTDRLNLDWQLFGTFSRARELLGASPKQAKSRANLRELLKDLPAGGVIFTTIQKFGLEKGEERFPVLSDRDNIVVIADEAHRTQYGLNAKLDPETGEYKYGLARCMRDALPNATFLAFTGTPISKGDHNTRDVFGEYVSIYDIQQAVDDGATVPIYYQPRLPELSLNEEQLSLVDAKVEEILDSETADEKAKAKAKSQWASLEKVVGSEPRLKLVAEDIISHYETRCETQPGKAMVVAMSREVCVRLYDQIVALRPDWHSEEHMQGAIKVVMTAVASDDAALQKHHTNAQEKRDIEHRFKNPADPLKIVIVRDMWLTGFDVPCLATMYVDKPMHGANLAQAIARVNRVFKDKPGGLVVDYIGIASELKAALRTYRAANGRGEPTVNTDKMLEFLREKLQEAADMLQPVDWSDYRTRTLALFAECMDRILEQEGGKRKYCDIVLDITKAFALCSTLDEARKEEKKIAFHQAIRTLLAKRGGETPPRDIQFELQDLLSLAIESEGVQDIFQLAGLDNPDISILSDEFLKEVQNMPHKNLAVELMQRLIEGGLKSRFRTNIVKQRMFSDLLEKSIAKYRNRVIDAAQVIEMLIAMAKKMRADLQRAKKYGLSQEAYAFFDALAQFEDVQRAMEEEKLVEIARAIAEIIRKNAKVDWTIREAVQANLSVLVESQLARVDYPDEQREEAVESVIQQAKVNYEDEMAA